MLLLFCRWVLGKNVHLLSVGYYNSAPRIGRLSAWFAAKAANTILARDEESYKNFKQLQTKTYRDTDIAWYIDELDLGPYEADLSRLEQQLKVSGKTLFITLRRFRDKQQDQLASIIHACISQNADKNIIVALMEPRHVDPAGYRLLRSWQRQFTKLQIVDCGLNPLAFFLFFRKYHDQLVFIGPQFHGILSAHLNDMPYLPLAYDNKVANLLKYIAPKTKPIGLESLRALDLQRFIDSTYGEQV
jgi:polysaccharide pyruvyl transferase WcaK-like protein